LLHPTFLVHGARYPEYLYEVSMFDYARLEDGRIVERMQQSDTLSQFRQMYSGAAKKGAVAVALLGAAAVFALGRRRARG
jgi:hypothetical protein